MRSIFLSMLLSVCTIATLRAQTTQPSDPPANSVAVTVRANDAFNAGDYQTALPLLQKIQADLKGKSDSASVDRLGQVEEQIRVCEKNATKTEVADASTLAVVPVLDIKAAADAIKPVARPVAQAPNEPSSAEERKPHPKPKDGETVELGIKQLGNFEYDAENGGNIPDDVKALDGCSFRTRGFMIPVDQADKITEFALVVDLLSCCFGQPPGVQHTITVHCPAGKAVSYFSEEIVVEGKLHVQEKKDDGYIISIFELDATSVQPAPK